MMDFIGSIFKPVTDLAGKMIMDKDKYAELQFKKIELREKRALKLLTITTTPRIDAFVKLLYAIKDVIIPMMRPLGAAGMTAFGIYAHINGLEIDPIMQGIFDGAFPAWGTSRHINKQTETKAKAENPPAFGDFD